jgi:hypothetical protein
MIKIQNSKLCELGVLAGDKIRIRKKVISRKAAKARRENRLSF